jgi:hypothetical protein
VSALDLATPTLDGMMTALALLPQRCLPPPALTGKRSGCLCVTASGALAREPGEVAAVRWDGAVTGTVADLARQDVESMRPGFTLSGKRYAGEMSSAARVEPKVGGR